MCNGLRSSSSNIIFYSSFVYVYVCLFGLFFLIFFWGGLSRYVCLYPKYYYVLQFFWKKKYNDRIIPLQVNSMKCSPNWWVYSCTSCAIFWHFKKDYVNYQDLWKLTFQSDGKFLWNSFKPHKSTPTHIVIIILKWTTTIEQRHSVELISIKYMTNYICQ